MTDDFLEWLLKYEWFRRLPGPLKCFLKDEFDKYVAMGWDAILKHHEVWERERGFFGYLSDCYDNFIRLNERPSNHHMEMVCWLFREARHRMVGPMPILTTISFWECGLGGCCVNTRKRLGP